MPIQHVRAPDEDWADLDTASESRRPEVVRELIRWYLRRPGARLPERPQARDWAAARADAALDWFSSLGHAVDRATVERDEDGQPVWRCSQCGSHLTITAKGKTQSATGKTRCTGQVATQ
ncbi:hypothetical protein ACFTZF_01275 [Streptomyces mirabilis]|uniref:hypothetical protein n=1 Tax=Streptomyces mirabilis TaxID=68239 RepID=UPI003638DE1B